MYRFEEIEMLAEKIGTIFEQGEQFRNNAQQHARVRHEAFTNTSNLYGIYQKIINNDSNLSTLE